MARRYLEFQDDKSDKFWEIERTGKAFTVRFGKRGTPGKTHQKTFATEAEAEKEFEKLVQSKLKKGYKDADGTGSATSSSGAGAKASNAAKPMKKTAAKKKTAKIKYWMNPGDDTTFKYHTKVIVGEPLRKAMPDCDTMDVSLPEDITEEAFDEILDDVRSRGYRRLDISMPDPAIEWLPRFKRVNKLVSTFLPCLCDEDYEKEIAGLLELKDLETIGVMSVSEDKALPLFKALAKLPNFKGFDSILCNGLDDACLKLFERSKTLEQITIASDKTHVTDAGFESLGKIPTLKYVTIADANISDRAIRALHGCKNLKELTLGTPKRVTREALQELFDALPACTIRAEQGVFEAESKLRKGKPRKRKRKIPSQLTVKIFCEIRRLGGKLGGTGRKDKDPNLQHLSPICQFLYGVQWPKGVTYHIGNDEFSSVADVDFRDAEIQTDFEMFACCQGRKLVSCGSADDSHSIILLDLDSDDLADPTIEIIDSEDFEEECMYKTQALSSFLEKLERQ